MDSFTKCIIYLALVGIVFFFIGRLFEEREIDYYSFPYKSLAFEKNGEIYLKIGVRKWQKILPDMSKIFPHLMPVKKLPKVINTENIKCMITETCIAEATHNLLCIMGLGCILIWKSIGGCFIFTLYMFGNIPYSLIQRYNRARFIRLLEKVREKESDIAENKEECINEEGSDIKLQYWART